MISRLINRTFIRNYLKVESIWNIYTDHPDLAIQYFKFYEVDVV